VTLQKKRLPVQMLAFGPRACC